MRRGAMVLALVLSAAVAAPGGAQTDSAGVRVITNPAPRPNGPAFKLSAQPRVSIGTVEGAPEYQLFRANQALVLSEGTIVISNTGTQELRFYDKAGKYVRTAGRKGQGPGEFMQPNLIGAFGGDSLVIADGGLKRVSVFDKSGTFGRSYVVPDDLGFQWFPVGVLADGRMAAIMNPIGPSPEFNPRLRRPQTIYLVARDGSSVQSLGQFPGMETIAGGPGVGLGVGLPLGRSLFARAGNDRIAFGNNDAYSVRIYDSAGKPLQVVRQTRQAVAARKEDMVLGLPPAFRTNATPNTMMLQMQALVDKAYKYTTLPAWGNPGDAPGALRFDPSGNLWVQEYAAIDRNDSWQAFSPAGAFLGRLDLPARTTLLQIGTDWVLVKTIDDLDVEHVVLYGLVKP